MSWDERFKAGSHGNLKPMPFLVDLAARLEPPPGRMADLACGAGRHALLFARRGWSVTAIDSSSVALELIRAHSVDGIETRLLDLEAAPVATTEEPWDLVVMTYFLHRPLLGNLRKLLRPGGRAAIAIPLSDDDREGVRAMNPAYLLESLDVLAASFPGADWRIEHLARVTPEPPARAHGEVVAIRL